MASTCKPTLRAFWSQQTPKPAQQAATPETVRRSSGSELLSATPPDARYAPTRNLQSKTSPRESKEKQAQIIRFSSNLCQLITSSQRDHSCNRRQSMERLTRFWPKQSRMTRPPPRVVSTSGRIGVCPNHSERRYYEGRIVFVETIQHHRVLKFCQRVHREFAVLHFAWRPMIWANTLTAGRYNPSETLVHQNRLHLSQIANQRTGASNY